MATQSDIVRHSDFINQLVLDRTTLEELGRVEVLWMYPKTHRVFGFICKSGFLGTRKSAFKLDQVDAIGANGVLTHGQPDAADAEKVHQLESLINREVWSDAGNRVGKIIDCLFDLKTGAIAQYLFVSNGWTGIAGDIYQLPPSQIISLGQKRVLVSEPAARGFAVYREGIQQKLKEGYSEATRELRSLTDQAKERAQLLSQQARERAKLFNAQFKEKGQEWVEQAREKTQTLAEQMKEQAEHVREQTQSWSDWPEEAPTLTVEAKEIAEPASPDLNDDWETGQTLNQEIPQDDWGTGWELNQEIPVQSPFPPESNDLPPNDLPPTDALEAPELAPEKIVANPEEPTEADDDEPWI